MVPSTGIPISSSLDPTASNSSSSALFITAANFVTPISVPSLLILSAVSRLRAPGSTTTIIRSMPLVVPLPRCSMPASISIITTDDSFNTTCRSSARRKDDAGHIHPLPPLSTVPITSILTPSGPTTPKSSIISSTFGLSLNIPAGPPALSSIRSSYSVRGAGGSSIPSAEARFISGSASMASTSIPSCARSRASVPASVVLPTPPFPVIAIFMVLQHIGNYKGISISIQVIFLVSTRYFDWIYRIDRIGLNRILSIILILSDISTLLSRKLILQ